MAHNLGVILRALIGVGKPREWAAMRAFLASFDRFWSTIWIHVVAVLRRIVDSTTLASSHRLRPCQLIAGSPSAACSTGS